MSTPATVGAARFLANQWSYLNRRFASGDFCVVLRVTTLDGKGQEILCERGESALAPAQ